MKRLLYSFIAIQIVVLTLVVSLFYSRYKYIRFFYSDTAYINVLVKDNESFDEFRVESFDELRVESFDELLLESFDDFRLESFDKF